MQRNIAKQEQFEVLSKVRKQQWEKPGYREKVISGIKASVDDEYREKSREGGYLKARRKREKEYEFWSTKSYYEVAKEIVTSDMGWYKFMIRLRPYDSLNRKEATILLRVIKNEKAQQQTKTIET